MVTHVPPLFKYFGGKHRWALRYPAPLHNTIVEPFAGSAGYSCRYPSRNIILVDADKRVTDLWQWLITVDPREILAIPDVVEHVDEIADPMERLLVSCWVNTSPWCKRPCSWMREKPGHTSFWGAATRKRIAASVTRVRHWTAVFGSWQDMAVRSWGHPTTFFLDPPYEKLGMHYMQGSSGIDYAALGQWCLELAAQGHQVIVCENEGASWLPFLPIGQFCGVSGNAKGKAHRRSVESMWTNTPTAPPTTQGALW